MFRARSQSPADSYDVARLERDNVAQGFLDEVAHQNGMMPPGSRASLADGVEFGCSPSASMRQI